MIRGIDSIANATTPRSARRSIPARVRERREEADEDGPGRERGDVLSGRSGDPDNHLRACEQVAAGDDVGAGGRVLVVREPCSRARVALDRDREAGGREPPDRIGHERHPLLAGAGFFRDCDPHGEQLYGAGQSARKGTGAGPGNPRPVGSLLATFSAALEARDPYLKGHSTRVTAFAESLARLLGWRGSRLEALYLGGSLHDVGKISVDASVLRKSGPLTEQELEQIRRHPVTGARLVESFDDFEAALPYVLHHHERWDGFGYPHGLSGDGIPLEARVLGVADAFDAMTSARAYRPALTVEQALVELERCAGSQFDPELALAFVEGWRQGEITVPGRLVRLAI